MSLLNAALAMGGFALIIPLAIHLLFRSRYRTMDWGAMFLLRDVVQANRRRMQWHHWILLALRCAIPILLALAMARPLISSIRSMPGSQPISLILVVDESRSMSAAQRSTRTLGAVNRLLDSLSRKDEVIFIGSAQSNRPATSGSIQDAREDLRELIFDGAEVGLSDMVSAAIKACSVASHPFRRIVICSDFQENVLPSPSSSESPSVALDTLADQLRSIRPEVELDFLNVAADEDLASLGNVVVESIEVENPAVLVDRRVAISAVIKNHSEASIPALRCVWSVDGVEMQTEKASLLPRGSTTLRWSHVFERVGGAGVTLSVEYNDALPADNQRRLAVEIMRQIRVWLIDGSPSKEALKGETDFLKVALSPFAFQSTNPSNPNSNTPGGNPGNLRDVVSTKVMTVGEFRRTMAKWNLPKRGDDEIPDLIVLANVGALAMKPTLDDEFDQAMNSYLQQNGNVLVFDGDQINENDWNDSAWMPSTPKQIIEVDRSFRIEPPGGRYKPWALLGRSGDSLLDSVEVQRIRRLQPRDERTSVLMRSDDGQPLVLERGQTSGGRVVQFAIPCDPDWSNLPLRPVFLPLIQQLVLDLAGGSPVLNGPPGSTMRIHPPRVGSKLDQWRLTMPDGTSDTLAATDSSPLQFTNTSRVGVYRFLPLTKPLTESELAEPQLAASVRVIEISAQESILRSVTPETLNRTVARLGGQSFTNMDDWLGAANQDRFGLEIWRPLMVVMLLVMIAEVLWQQRGGTKTRIAGGPA